MSHNPSRDRGTRALRITKNDSYAEDQSSEYQGKPVGREGLTSLGS